MKRLQKLLAQLYPAAWRKRYGAEYEALIEDLQPRASDLFDVLRGAITMRVTSQSFVRIVLPCALAGTTAAWAISFARPVLYRSQAVFSIAAPDKDALDLELSQEAKAAFSEPFLDGVIQRENLYPVERSRMSQNEVVAKMKKSIYIVALQRKGSGSPAGFVLQFSYPDARVAQRVDAALAARMVEVNLAAAIRGRQQAIWQPPVIVSTTEANLPSRPVLPNRARFGAIGLFAGLVMGLIWSIVVRDKSGPVIG